MPRADASKAADKAKSAAETYPDALEPTCLSGKPIACVPPSEILKEVDGKTRKYQESLQRTDFALYDGLAKVYHFYLLAVSGSPDHESALNQRVREYFKATSEGDATKADPRKDNFEIKKEPSTNLFGNLLRATLLNVIKTPGNNHPDPHIPEKANTWSMALHWCLRRKWAPEEALAELQACGVRKFYDNEMDARANEKSGGGGDDIDPAVQAEAAVKSVGSLPPLGPAINIGPVRPSATGLGVFLARIKEGTGGSVIEIVSQVERTDSQLRADARELLDKERLNGSPAGPVIHLLRLSREFLGKLDRCENLIRISSGKPQFLMKVKERSEKTAKHLAAEFHAAIDGLDETLPYYLIASDADVIFSLAEKDASVENWRFANALNEEHLKEDLEIQDYFLEVDTSSGPKRWKLVSASAAEETSLKSLDAGAGQPAFTIGRIAWRSLIAFAQQKRELKDDAKEGFAPGYDFGVIDDSLLVNTIGTKVKGDPVSLTLISNDGSSPRFELRHKTLMSMDELQNLSSDGSLSFSLGDGGAMVVSATGKRATYAVFLNKDIVEKPPKGKGKGKKAKAATEAKPADQPA